MAEFLLLINPTAASGDAGTKRALIEGILRRGGEPFRTALTEHSDHATELVRCALRGGAPGVVVVGGDGTTSEALGGFFEVDGTAVRPGAWLAPLPCGTGGDFRRTVYPERRLRSLAAGLRTRRPRPLDVGWAEFRDDAGAPAARPFLNIASFGLGGLIDRYVNEAPKVFGGRVAFALGTLRALHGYGGRRVALSLDGGSPEEHTIANIAVANGQFFGGGMHIAPTARIDDGWLDIVTLPWLGAIRQVALAKDLYGGTILACSDINHVRAKVIDVEPLDENAVLLDIDGEAPGRLPARFSLRQHIVRLR